MEFERSKVVAAPAERVFDVVSDVERMPSWLPTTERAAADGADHVHVEGERGSQPYEGDGLFRAQRDQLRLEWGSDRTGEYAGWLQIHHQAQDDRSEVVIHLSFFEELDERYRASRAQAVEAELEEALDTLAEQVAAG
ncbi:polyketide cyclase/dehydrase/lipid transport protein [Motilibacter rhizosphaerae]|uniref:Polyketide cyclase/dehydrase/lipid transport protein n=1 Tax=Motilibacter rhizosphaerae TaxID=598652 RepID=A0A4Q7NS72_9ACTN|nr:SRPBCC family protein [Motilibacter rhizosphaerae]RZS89855.1 polyketide cyclase/dehydrase/lipid transport protein [Motilibacter rhizosphaerae]